MGRASLQSTVRKVFGMDRQLLIRRFCRLGGTYRMGALFPAALSFATVEQASKLIPLHRSHDVLEIFPNILVSGCTAYVFPFLQMYFAFGGRQRFSLRSRF